MNKFTFSKIIFLLLLLFAPTTWSNDLITVVKQQKKIASGEKIDLDGLENSGAHPEHALLNAPSLSLIRQGGSLSNTIIKYRGLSDARLSVDVDGLEIADPVNGLLDASDLPLFATPTMTLVGEGAELASSLSLALPPVGTDFAQASAGFGSSSTADISVLAQKCSARFSTLLGFRLAITKGDFPFAATSITGADLDAILVRQNNDQRRSQFVWRSAVPAFGWKANWLAMGTFHEGGIVGFAHSPSTTLRDHKVTGGANLKLGKQLSSGYLTINAHSRVHQRKVSDAHMRVNENSITSLEHKAGATFNRWFSSAVNLKTTGLGTMAHILQNKFHRASAKLDVNGSYYQDTVWPLTLKAFVGGAIISDQGLLPSGSLGANISPMESLTLGMNLSANRRAPTLSELYSPQGLILGNSQLKAESSYDATMFAQLKLAEWSGNFTLFSGYLQDGIFYINQNAFEILPVNTGGGVRAGAELSAQWQALAILKFTCSSQLLYSRLLATRAPFPGTSPWSLRTSVQLGAEKQALSTWQLRYQAASASNLYGTLKSSSFTIIDWIVRIQLHDHIATTLSITNIFNILSARDTHQFPLPGREFFISLQSNYGELL